MENFYKGLCRKCGCVFCYDDTEIKRNLYHKYVECPVCNFQTKATLEPFGFNGQKATEYKIIMENDNE